MINKQSIWFTFLFSIILILSIFYVTMDSTDLDELIVESDTTDTTLVVNESTELVALRVQSDEEVMETITELQHILLDQNSDLTAKNDAYDELLNITNNKSIEQNLEKIISKDFKLDSFVKIKGNDVTIFIDSVKHDYDLANDIISRIAKEFKEDKYITVKFS